MTETGTRVVVELSGSNAERGIGLFDLESFIDAFLRGLRAFDRAGRLEPPRRSGHPTKRDALVTALQLVSLEPGSAVLTIEPAPLSDDGEMFADAASLAFSNLDGLLTAVDSDDVFDPDVAEALGVARRALGEGGRITVRRGDRRVVIDEATEKRLVERTNRPSTAGHVSVSGRLHAIDLEPERVGIRATDGVDWTCRYPDALEREITGLLGETVWVQGTGRRTGAQRGSLDIEALGPVGPFEQSELFTYERVPLSTLLDSQGVRGPAESEAFTLPDDVTEEQLDGYLAAILDDGD